MQEYTALLHTMLEKIIEFLVNYSFQVIGALLVLFLGFKVAQWMASFLTKFCEKKQFDATLTKFASGMIKLSIIGFAVLVALGKFGITITPLVAGLSALGEPVLSFARLESDVVPPPKPRVAPKDLLDATERGKSLTAASRAQAD